MRINKLLILGLFCVFLSSGCTTMRKFNNHQLNKTHEWAYYDALDIIASAVPSDEIDKCGIIFNAPIPPTIRVSSYEEIEVLFGRKVNGFYNPNTHEVYYVKRPQSHSTLVHEYIHYIEDISNLNNYCKSQLIAYLGEYAHSNRLAVERWKQAYKRERRRQRR